LANGPFSQTIKTKADDDFLADLLGEVDTNIPAPVPRRIKRERSPERRKVRVISPVRETRQPAAKKTKILDDRLSPSSSPQCEYEQDGYIPPMDDGTDMPMSDPAPSSPAAKVAERKAQIKSEPNEDDDDMLEVAHAGAVTAASVNIAGFRPPKKILKPDPYPSPANSSPAKSAGVSVDPTSWNELTEKLNVVTSSPPETRVVGKIDYKDAIEEDGSLNMFWTDYTEVNGSLCLFGKVLNKKTKTYVSCFVKIDNILRKLYFLPRQTRLQDGEESGEEVGMMDVYTEVDEIMTKMNVGMYKIKKCTRKYAFELPGIPKESDYMKLLYPYTSKFDDRPKS